MHDLPDPAFRNLLDSARTADAVRTRSGVRSLRIHAGQDATVLGLLANLRDLERQVTLSTTSGANRSGFVEIVNSSGVIMRGSKGLRFLLALHSVTSVRTFDRCELSGDGTVDSQTSWPTLLATFIEDADDITVVNCGESITGKVTSCSRSLLAIQTPNQASYYAVVGTIDEVSLRVPGTIRHD